MLPAWIVPVRNRNLNGPQQASAPKRKSHSVSSSGTGHFLDWRHFYHAPRPTFQAPGLRCLVHPATHMVVEVWRYEDTTDWALHTPTPTPCGHLTCKSFRGSCPAQTITLSTSRSLGSPSTMICSPSSSTFSYETPATMCTPSRTRHGNAAQ